MPLPAEIFLRSRDGDAIGPLPMRTLEVLYDAKIVDEGTPISADGAAFRPIRETADVLRRMIEVKQMLVSGIEPWVDEIPLVELPPEPEMLQAGEESLTKISPLKAMFNVALAKAKGYLTFHRDDGSVMLNYIDGKIVEISSTIDSLSIGDFLIQKGVINPMTLSKGLERAPAMGGDLGGALISLGLIPPHTYFERFMEWAKTVLRNVMAWETGRFSFTKAEIKQPPVPLGFDRWGILIDTLRASFDRDRLEKELGYRRGLVVIPSQVEGASFEEVKLDAKELRVVKAIDGVKTLGNIMESNLGRGEAELPALRAIYYVSTVGFVVFGEDQLLPKEREEARKMMEKYKQLAEKGHFDVLSVSRDSNDDSVRNKYKDLAKLYHPDTLRPHCAPELAEAKGKLFDLIKQAYEAIDTEEKRYRYWQLQEQGIARGQMNEEEMAKNMIEAEIAWKKAEALVKMRKYDEANAMIDEAVEKKPKDIELKIYQSFYRYLAAKGAGQSEAAEKAIKEIQAFLKGDPNIASGYLFLARLHKALNKPDLTAKFYKKLLEFDERNHEAESELRLHSMRSEKEKKKGKLF